MTYEQLAKLAEESGFTGWAPLDVSTIVLRPEVRDMCAVNTCQQYDKRWSCPPGCGTLEENTARLKSYTRGIRPWRPTAWGSISPGTMPWPTPWPSPP